MCTKDFVELPTGGAMVYVDRHGVALDDDQMRAVLHAATVTGYTPSEVLASMLNDCIQTDKPFNDVARIYNNM